MAVYDISSIVVSSRIRLARNIDKMPMPPRLSKEQGSKVLDLVARSVSGLDEFKIYRMKTLPARDAWVMQEKHLISKDLIEQKDYGAVILNSDESVAIMVNEEDHIREQCFIRGLELERAYETLDTFDNKMLEKLNVAFDQKMGFLTSCVTNLGTGMRASVLCFLPALTLSGEMSEIINQLSLKGICVRGVYGEASGFDGFMYQISNSRSLGSSEREIIASVKASVIRMCELENHARKKLLATREVEITDRVLRAFGVLSNCYTLSSSELYNFAGEVKMGIALGILRLKDNGIFDRLVVETLPHNLSKIANIEFEGEEEGVYRAQYVRNKLANQRVK